MSDLRIVPAPGAPAASVTAEDCAALPDSAQVPDVSALAPGRRGRGVRLSALLARAGAGPKTGAPARFLNVASRDPAFSVSLPLAEAAGALVVYELDGAPLPAAKGGPFRLVVPGHPDECVHVKQVASLELSDRAGRDTRPVDDAEHQALHRKGKAPSVPEPHSPAPKLPPHVAVLDMITGYWISCGIHVAARYRIADLLAGGPKGVAELAAAAEANAPTLYRLLRMLASRGVFRETEGKRFENTPLSETLRADVPGSMHGFAVMMVNGYNLDAWKELHDSVRTGETAFHKVFGMRAFEWLSSHPEEAQEFGRAMTSISGAENPAVAEALDVTGVAKLVDVGGGHGSLLAAVLRRNPGLRGVVYDRPEVIAAAKKEPHLKEKDLAERCELVAGSFFDSVPAGADACLMKYILHDWEDELCVRILTNCRRAMGPKGKVFVVDNVIPSGNDPHWGKLLDINMLVLAGGRERTREEFGKIFAAAGFKLWRVVETKCPLSIVAGVAAG